MLYIIITKIKHSLVKDTCETEIHFVLISVGKYDIPTESDQWFLYLDISSAGEER